MNLMQGQMETYFDAITHAFDDAISNGERFRMAFTVNLGIDGNGNNDVDVTISFQPVAKIKDGSRLSVSESQLNLFQGGMDDAA